ncbi:MAG: flagellar hook-associated protein FlgL [Methylococcaceae bacterium]|nr:flagellar hook-associated protein FlgL [Methylococcaceae bacterium]
MRITTSLSQQLGVKAITDQQARLGKTQLQLATGLKILTPSDNPVDSARILDLNQSLASTEQYTSNILVAQTRLSLEEITLDSATNGLQRLRQLAVQGANATLNASDRASIESEARQILDELLALSNTQNANGEYLFSGFHTNTQSFTGTPTTPPGGFVYNGDGNQRLLQVGSTRFIADGDDGLSAFGDPSAGTSAFDVVAQFADNMGANTPDTNDIVAIDVAMERIDAVRSTIGARMNSLDQQRELNDGIVLDIRETLSEVQDLDYAEAISRLNLQSTVLQAAQQAYVQVQGLSLFNYL